MIKRPKRLVLLGRSLGHSLSPIFQNAALQQAQLPLRYETLDIPASAIDGTLEELSAQDAAGNVTVPYKQDVFARCDRLMDSAKRAGAVNTFWFERGELVGDNTDVAGFDAAARELLQGEPAGLTIGLIGAGGVAGAVLAAIEGWRESKALVSNRTTERARALCARFSSVAQLSDVDCIAREADLVVNATTVGLRDDALPVDPARLRPSAAVLDVVYRRGETAWVRAARSRGLRARDGLLMLVEQGAVAFERWFGFAPDRDAMWRSMQ
ncbi:MAG TPA: shikimate dehydrogenase [Gemmatimonadaceae bacterium]|jgi:shikimate dehydrogenase